jgi:dihydroorotate dehydrogenase
VSELISATHSATFYSRQKFASIFADIGTAALRLLPAELAHDIGLGLMKAGVLNYLPQPAVETAMAGMKVRVPGIGELPHPIGLAAGFDKNCKCPAAFVRMGFSMVEIGTVTPFGQTGNPKPRLFRQSEQRALINRMGFNGDGAATVSERLKKLNWSNDRVPIGINCGKNKVTPPERAIQDYLQVMEAFKGLSRYFVVNISSPNTPGLRDLATPAFIEQLADEVGNDRTKIWVKIDPDMSKREFQELVATISDRGFQGVILSNTHRVTFPEVGGQSGHPVMALSTACLEWAWEVHKGSLPMIASGGVLSGIDLFQKLSRGASAVQIYTALVYRGPWVVWKLLLELNAEMRLRGFSCVEDFIGSYYEH